MAKGIKTVFGVRWIEVEFGQRDEGWALYTDKDRCVEATKKASQDGTYAGGYMGPERPLRMYEIPFDCLDEDMRKSLKKSGHAWTPNHWNPKFKDSGSAI
jgi:hypothetical protein